MELAYKKLGEGQPLIILHGLYGMSDNWISIGRELAKNYEVYLLDLRNHGDSPHAETMTYTEMAKDVFVFFNHHSIEEAVVLGHSMGGKTATFFAALYPELVKKLIVVDISPVNNQKKTESSRHEKIHRGIVSALESLNLQNAKSRTEISKKLESRLNNKAVAQFLMKNITRDRNNNFSWKLNLHAISNGLGEIFRGLDENTISNIELFQGIPSLFVIGGKSDYLAGENIELIKKLMPLAQFETIKDAGHWVHAEKPDEFLLVLNSFLE